jgi:uncharacterized protein
MKIELRNDSVLLDGYVNVPERRSKMLSSPHGKFVEIVAEGTFNKALHRNDDVKVLLNHDETRELGSQKQGNLDLYEDNIGLRALITVTDADVITKAKNNELRGFSFGFNAINQKWEDTGEGYQKRTLTDIDLREISILDNTKIPAYNATSIEMRNNSEFILEMRDFIDDSVDEPVAIVTDDTTTAQNGTELDGTTDTANPEEVPTIQTQTTTETTTTTTTTETEDTIETDYSYYENSITVMKLKANQ